MAKKSISYRIGNKCVFNETQSGKYAAMAHIHIHQYKRAIKCLRRII